MYNALAESYQEANQEGGHAMGCGYGAGADCYCAASDTYLVTVVDAGEVVPVYAGDVAEAKAVAVVARGRGLVTRLRRLDRMAVESMEDAGVDIYGDVYDNASRFSFAA